MEKIRNRLKNRPEKRTRNVLSAAAAVCCASLLTGCALSGTGGLIGAAAQPALSFTSGSSPAVYREDSPADRQGEASGAEEEEQETEAVSEPGTITVYLCGYVNSPGVCFLEEGARLYEAVEAAGGLSSEAQAWRVNLAAALSDGEMIYIPGPGSEDEERQAQALQAAAGNTVSGSRVNLNTAGKEELMTIPGIGEAKAVAILDYRKSGGVFTVPEDIMKVPGIKEKAFEKLKEYISV